MIKWLARWFGQQKQADTEPAATVREIPEESRSAPAPQGDQAHASRETTASAPTAPGTPAAQPAPSTAPTRQRDRTQTTARGWLTRPIFITSTFRDLHAERDWLRAFVFPELEERLRSRRVRLEPIDLRLGVDTEAVSDEGARELEVLKVCLAEIKRSQPFLIGLIGERYGWIPPPAPMRAAADEAGFAGAVAGKSVTELEIAYGVLANPAQQQRSTFYLRQPLPCDKMDAATAARYADSHATDAAAAERAAKLSALKARLQDQLPDRLRPYTAVWDGHAVGGLEAFGAQVLEDLWRDLDAETRERIGAAEPTWQESEREALQEFLEQRSTGFIGRSAELERLQRLCRDDASEVQALCLTGNAGAGKSALFATLARRLTPAESPPAENPAAAANSAAPLLLVHAAGVSPRSGQAEMMVRRWVGELAQALDIAEPIDERTPADELREAFRSLLQRAALTRRVVVFIDALDQFVIDSPLAWLPTPLPANLRLVATAITGSAGEAFAQRFGFSSEALAPLDEAAAQRIIETLCNRYHHHLNPRVTQAILAKRLPDGRPACSNPLWLTLAVDEMNLLDEAAFVRAESGQSAQDGQSGHSSAASDWLTPFLLGIAEELPAEVGPAYQWLLKRAEKLHGEARCRGFAAPLALARAGLREADFAELLPQLTGEPWQPLAFAALRRSFRAHVVARGARGQWDFTHAQMRQAALARYLPEEDQRRELHAVLAAHFGGLEADDPLHQSETMGHLIAADDQSGAATLYGGELTDRELAGATAALAEYVLQAREVGAGWVAGLTEQPLAPEALGRLGERFNFKLDQALAPRGRLGPRRRIAEASLGVFERLAAADPASRSWQRDLAVSHINIGDLLWAQGDLGGAGSAYQASLAICEREVAADPIDVDRQRDLSLSHEKIGDLLSAQGDLTGAGAAYQASLAIREALATFAPASAVWQVYLADLASSHESIGGVLLAQGDLAGAGAAFRASLGIAEGLTAGDPSNARWHRDLASSHHAIGDILMLQGDLSGAGAAYQASLAICESLARADPENQAEQRCLAVAYEKIGNLLTARGDLTSASEAYRATLTTRKRLAADDPGNAGWQRDLWVSCIKIGELLWRQGDLPGTNAAFRESLTIAERLTAVDPRNADWQSNLAGSQERIGALLKERGDLAGAGAAHRASLAIRERLTAIDPSNAEWQRCLSLSHNHIGDLLTAQNDLAGAGTAYREGRAIIERLAATDPGNAGWQCDLAAAHDRIGDLLKAQDDLAGAGTAYRASLAIAERLTAADPDNAVWQRDLSISHEKIGNLLKAQGDLAGAGAEYQASLTIIKELVATDAGNAGWQRHLSVSYNNIGDILKAQGNLAGAGTAYRASVAIRERLTAADPDNAGWQHDLSVSLENIGSVLHEQGDVAGAVKVHWAIMVICERLAAAEPDNARWQNNLWVSHYQLAALYSNGDRPEQGVIHMRRCVKTIRSMAGAGMKLDTLARQVLAQLEGMGM